MTGAPRYMTYRVSSQRFGVICLFYAIGMIVVLVRVAAITPLSGGVKALIDLVALAVFGLGLAGVRRSATVIKHDYLAVRGLSRVKRIPWADIQDIRVEMNLARIGTRRAPKELVIVYDQHGKRTTLPHLNQVTLTGHGMSLPAEVKALQNTWMQLRGEQWAPEPEVVKKITARIRYAMPSWLLGFTWSIAAILFGAVLVTIGLATGNGNPPPFLLSPLVILILPVATFAGVTTASVVARRRRR
jgi:Bacterial PH domain